MTDGMICMAMFRDKFVDMRELLITEMERGAHELEVEDAEVRLKFEAYKKTRLVNKIKP